MTTAIWRITRSLSRIELAEKSNDSAQSPACRSTARPSATAVSESRSARASPAKTSGGSRRSRSRAPSSASGSGHSGCWAAGTGPPRAGRPGRVASERRDRQRSRSSKLCSGGYRYWPMPGPCGLLAGGQGPPAHLLQLLLGRHLLRHHRGLDAVEEALQPAHQLGLGDAQLRLARGALVERQHDLAELLAEVLRQDLAQLGQRPFVDLAQALPAGVVERRLAHLLQHALDHGGDADQLRGLRHRLPLGASSLAASSAPAAHRPAEAVPPTSAGEVGSVTGLLPASCVAAARVASRA